MLPFSPMYFDKKISLKGPLLAFFTALSLYIMFITISQTIAWQAFDRAFTKRGESIVHRLANIHDEQELILAVKMESKQSSCRCTLLGSNSKPLYDAISKSDPTSMLIKTFPFSVNDRFFKLKIALSQNFESLLVDEFRHTLIAWGGVVAFCLWLILSFISLIRARFRMFYAKERLDQLEKEMLLDHLDEGVLIVDGNLHVMNANKQAALMFGVLKTHLLGDYFTDSDDLPPLAEKCVEALKRCLKNGIVVNGSYTDINPSRTYFDLVVTPAHQDAMIVIIQDQSSHYRMMKMGKDFIANASHELRTPITIIRGFIETLSEMQQVTESMLEDIIEKVMRNCTRMENLIKNLLILADLDYLPKNQVHECDVVGIVDYCTHTLKSVHKHVDIRLRQNKEKMLIKGDPDLLELAIMNLLQNAVKYSPKGPDLTVNLEEILGEVRVSVADRGCGIAEKDLRNIFDRFYTVDKARSRKLGGAGLGLSIVKMIVERHDGTISATSTVGEGTEFTASLPKS
jgi:signal transduction histidine kinase